MYLPLCCHSSYILDVGPKRFKYEAPSNNPLRFTQGGCVDQIIVVRPYINWVTEKNSTELFQAFNDGEKFLLGRCIVALSL